MIFLMLATLSSDVPIIHKVGKPERPAKPDIPYVQTYAGWFVGILLMANHNPYINWVGFSNQLQGESWSIFLDLRLVMAKWWCLMVNDGDDLPWKKSTLNKHWGPLQCFIVIPTQLDSMIPINPLSTQWFWQFWISFAPHLVRKYIISHSKSLPQNPT